MQTNRGEIMQTNRRQWKQWWKQWNWSLIVSWTVIGIALYLFWAWVLKTLGAL